MVKITLTLTSNATAISSDELLSLAERAYKLALSPNMQPNIYEDYFNKHTIDYIVFLLK